jgi:hypothetical protein
VYEVQESLLLRNVATGKPIIVTLLREVEKPLGLDGESTDIEKLVERSRLCHDAAVWHNQASAL